jgi:competence protein ComEA
MSQSIANSDTGADAAAAPAASTSRPLVLRTVIGALALLGLSGIGAVSMLAGLDGAHASPPVASHTTMAPSSASTGPAPSAIPSVAAPQASASAPLVPPEPETVPCAARTEDGRVILNLAKLEDLRKIPGIGPKRAEAILALRTKLKRFKRGSDLLRVRGIGPKSLTRMQSHFVVDPPAGSPCTTASANTK